MPEKLNNTKRLDVEMHLRGIARSRSEASDLISRGKVTVNGIIVQKSSTKVSSSDLIAAVSTSRFVSRAGEKLECALDAFRVDAEGTIAADIGSSTGGFTDCLLQRGASKVIAIDVGTGQFAPELRSDPRIELHESTDVRRHSIISAVDLVVMDVSFISLSLVLPKAFEYLKPGGKAIALVKPQFEVGMEAAKKFKGVIADDSLQRDALERIKKIAVEIGFDVISDILSPIEGEKGNKEFLLLLEKRS